MNLHKYEDLSQTMMDLEDYDQHSLAYKKLMRQKLEDRLEMKRLKDELEFFEGELDEDFDWNYFDK